ncbi:MAG: DNA translocase FtsK [Dehalococcoidales bacterium]|jgi:S-DNA-T family DNA segregation ATPase FtsK/SpoIIIE
MAKKKVNAKAKSRPKSRPVKRGSSGGLKFFASGPFWQLVVLFTIIALAAVFRDPLSDFFKSVWTGIRFGAIFIAGIIILIVVMTWKRQLGSFFTYWNRWLGGAVFVLAAWALLGIIRYNTGFEPNVLGGSFGFGLAGSQEPTGLGVFTGILCMLGFFILGIIFVLPRQSFLLLQKFANWVWALTHRRADREGPAKDIKQPAMPRGMQPRHSFERPSQPRDMEGPLVPPEVTLSRKKLEDLAEKAVSLKPSPRPPAEPDAPFKSDLKQVASDVWKKYGQSSDLVVVDGWSLPPVDILDTSPEVQFSEADNLQRAKLIEDTLGSYGVDSKVVQINAGPTVTQFGVEPGWDVKYKEIKEKDRDGKTQVRREEVSRTRVKVERINSLSNDLALALAAPTIRIEAPVPGKSFVGVEVPNTTSDMVSLRGVVETSNFQKLVAKTKMALALGKGAGGEAIASDLTKMPHLLIAGATGSGKTVCLNTIVCCLMMHNTPNDVRFILIDPKRVELTQYNSIPHLATPVIVDTTKALAALRWLCQEMDDRYRKLAAAGARHIEGYNKDKKGTDILPYLVLVIDELADLMMAGYDEVETNLCRLAQLARATGIHLVVATQRPSVDVVTGLIKANFPTRISFAVTSQVDSRTILDGAGAEKLLGRGDMLFMPTEAAKPKRLQGCFLSDAEIDRLVYFWGSQKKEEPDKLKMETLIATTPSGTIGGFPRDPLLEQAKELAHENDDVSVSFLQRKLHIGYPRAARLKDQLDAVLSKEGDVAESTAESIDEEEGGEAREDLS